MIEFIFLLLHINEWWCQISKNISPPFYWNNRSKFFFFWNKWMMMFQTSERVIPFDWLSWAVSFCSYSQCISVILHVWRSRLRQIISKWMMMVMPGSTTRHSVWSHSQKEWITLGSCILFLFLDWLDGYAEVWFLPLWYFYSSTHGNYRLYSCIYKVFSSEAKHDPL